ncbi:universal stress protein [Angustibacter sp. McL0619]|uniref:universal stress protein n=1 Tax=Angustibacter sp. McL0619 TaxID=3415676 RepID=UPI003CF51294
MARQRSGSVVVGYADGSSESALAWAADEAASTGLRLTLLHALAGEARHRSSHGDRVPGPSIDHVELRAEQNAVSEVADVAERVRGAYPQLDVTTTFVHEHAGRSLVEVSHEAALLVVGAGPAGQTSSGGVLEHVLARAECTLVVVPAAEVPGTDDPTSGSPPQDGLVVVGVEDVEQSQDAIGYGSARADRRGGSVTVIDLTASSLDDLCRAGRAADVVVIEAFGRRRSARHHLRATVDALVQRAGRPVVVVRG